MPTASTIRVVGIRVVGIRVVGLRVVGLSLVCVLIKRVVLAAQIARQLHPGKKLRRTLKKKGGFRPLEFTLDRLMVQA